MPGTQAKEGADRGDNRHELRGANRLRQSGLGELQALGHDVPDLYPDLEGRWDSNNKQWTWKIPTLESIPNLATGVDLTSHYQPPGSGPMPVPTG